jgi:hypothetical protein
LDHSQTPIKVAVSVSKVQTILEAKNKAAKKTMVKKTAVMTLVFSIIIDFDYLNVS